MYMYVFIIYLKSPDVSSRLMKVSRGSSASIRPPN